MWKAANLSTSIAEVMARHTDGDGANSTTTSSSSVMKATASLPVLSMFLGLWAGTLAGS